MGIQVIKNGINPEEYNRNYDVVPLVVNSTQTLNNTAADKDFVSDDNRGGQGMSDSSDVRVKKVFLIVQGVAINTFAGSNALDSTTASHNQWQANLDGGTYFDLVNGTNTDGQMLDNDWRCAVEGAAAPFLLMFDVTDDITNIDGNIGVRLQNGRAEQISLLVTISAFLRVVWGT